MNEFGQKGKVPLSAAFGVTRGGKRPHGDRTDLHSQAISSGDLKAKSTGGVRSFCPTI